MISSVNLYNTIVAIFLGIFAAIDKIIYLFLELSFMLFFNIIDFTINNDIIATIVNRIYVVLGIVMLFKVSVSLLNGIINPDSLTDKQNGMGKIVSRTIIMLILLIMFPTVFEVAMNAQKGIVTVIPKVILGRAVSNDNNDIYREYAGEIVTATMSAFIVPNTESCGDFGDNPGLIVEVNGVDTWDLVTEKCSNSLTDNDEFKYNYIFLISSITGIVLTLIIFFYCFDVAARAFKLIFLKIIAPIPILTYIDPKSAKGGAFDNWLKLTIKTYISIFIKLAGMYFVVALLPMLINQTSLENIAHEIISLEIIYDIVLIIGAFIFLTQIGKMIDKIFGLDKDKEKGIMSTVLGTTAAVAGGAAISAGGAAISAKMAGGQISKELLRSTAIKGALSSGLNAFSGKKFDATNAYQTGRNLEYRSRTGESGKAPEFWEKWGVADEQIRGLEAFFSDETVDENGNTQLELNEQAIDEGLVRMGKSRSDFDHITNSRKRMQNMLTEAYNGQVELAKDSVKAANVDAAKLSGFNSRFNSGSYNIDTLNNSLQELRTKKSSLSSASVPDLNAIAAIDQEIIEAEGRLSQATAELSSLGYEGEMNANAIADFLAQKTADAEYSQKKAADQLGEIKAQGKTLGIKETDKTTATKAREARAGRYQARR